MTDVKSYRDLIAWQQAMALCKRVYEATKLYPKEERFGLVQQSRRAAVSAPSNIAEGWGRGALGDYLRFLAIARSSLFELETQILLARDLEYLTGPQAESLLSDTGECCRVLQGLIGSLERIWNQT